MKVLICANCKDYWIEFDNVNYCGSCGGGSLEPTHESNYINAKNLDRSKIRVDSRLCAIEGFCNPWLDNNMEVSVIKLTKNFDKWGVASSMCMPSNIKEAIIIQKCINDVFSEYHRIKDK